MAGKCKQQQAGRQAGRQPETSPNHPNLDLAFAGSEPVTCASFRIYWDLHYRNRPSSILCVGLYIVLDVATFYAIHETTIRCDKHWLVLFINLNAQPSSEQTTGGP